MAYEVIVVGGGIGGLTAAAVLARRGLNVCLLERQSEVGGCAATVEHLRYRFDPTYGLHSGWEPGGVYERLCEQLAVAVPQARELSRPYVVRLPDGSDVPRPNSERDFQSDLRSSFPECAEAAVNFYRDLHGAKNTSTIHSNTWAAQMVDGSSRFRDFVDIQLRTLTQSSLCELSYELAAKALAPDRRFWSIEGGTQTLINLLAESFQHSGGKLRLNAPVLRLAYGSEGSPVGVDLLSGERVLFTRAVISNLTVWDTYGKLVGPARTPRAISSDLRQLTGWGIYQMFLTLTDEAVAALPADKILAVTNGEDGDAPERQLIFCLGQNAGEGKRTAVVSVYTRAEDWFSFHEDHTALEEREQSMLETTWARLNSALPQVTAGAELIETATPHTYYENVRRRFGMVGRPSATLTGKLTSAAASNLWLVGDTVAGGFGIDDVVESARCIAYQIAQ
jgi:phytoene dehydrogenase-like protein